MNTQPNHYNFRPASDCLSGAEQAFVAEFVVQVQEYARRSGQEILTALDAVGRSGQSFDWRASEFLAIERVRTAVYERCADADAKARVSAAALRAELSAMAFSNMQDYCKADPLNPAQVTFDFSNLTPVQWAAVAEITYEESVTGDKRKYKLKLHDKKTAIALLAEHIGFNDPNNPYRTKELTREIVAQPLQHFAEDAPLSGLQDAYARLLNRTGGL